jgi:hypothetical protein
MSQQEKLAAFSKKFLKGQPIPHDLEQMLLMQWNRVEQEDLYVDPLQALGARLIEDGTSYPLIDHSYLNDKDRADPDIMANIKAIDVITAMCSFVAEDDDSALFGYWHGPQNLPASEAPIITFNTEGQFELSGGRNLAEALMSHWIFEEDEFEQRKGWFAQYGVDIVATSLDDFPVPETDVLPEELHEQRYYEFKGEK